MNECVDGYWDSRCNRSCSDYCLYKCNKDTGHCNSCQPGQYGEHCQLPCPQNCLGSCHQQDGVCDQCKAGYHGKHCETNCPVDCSDDCMRNGSCSCKPGSLVAGCQVGEFFKLLFVRDGPFDIQGCYYFSSQEIIFSLFLCNKLFFVKSNLNQVLLEAISMQQN